MTKKKLVSLNGQLAILTTKPVWKKSQTSTREALTKHKPTTPMTRILLYLRRFEAWFNARFGWFFTNPNKLDRWEREAWEKRDQ